MLILRTSPLLAAVEARHDQVRLGAFVLDGNGHNRANGRGVLRPPHGVASAYAEFVSNAVAPFATVNKRST